jgi:hypothetical protein
MAPSSIRVFVNARAIDVPAGSTAIDAVRAWQSDAADAVTAGERIITDSRGLPIGGDAPASAGSIFRVITSRERGSDSSAVA